MKTKSETVVDRVAGYDSAIACLDSWCAAFNESNGVGRMSRAGLRTIDDEGSGEYYRAICVDSDETYEIVSGC